MTEETRDICAKQLVRLHSPPQASATSAAARTDGSTSLKADQTGLIGPQPAGFHAAFAWRRRSARSAPSRAYERSRPAPAAPSRPIRHAHVIEGERPGRERERFTDLLGSEAGDKFVEVGSGNDVIRKLGAVRELAAETDQLRVGGIIDRDLRTDEQSAALASDAGVYVLPCHEIENLFLHPAGIAALLEHAGRSPEEAAALTRNEADKYAGRWIIQYAMVTESWDDLAAEIRNRARRWSWEDIAEDVDGKMRELATADPDIGEGATIRRKAALVSAARVYETYRCEDDEPWKRCFGKEVLRGLAPGLGLSSADAVEARLVRLWDSGDLPRPQEVEEIRAYVDRIRIE